MDKKYETLDDGSRVRRSGATVFLVDSRGYPRSFPFHEIIPDGDGYRGTLGADTYRLSREGRLVEQSRLYPFKTGLDILRNYAEARWVKRLL